MAAAKFLSQDGLTYLWGELKKTFVKLSGSGNVTISTIGSDSDGYGLKMSYFNRISGAPVEQSHVLIDKSGVQFMVGAGIGSSTVKITKDNIANLAACLASGSSTGSADVTELSNSEIDAILAL